MLLPTSSPLHQLRSQACQFDEVISLAYIFSQLDLPYSSFTYLENTLLNLTTMKCTRLTAVKKMYCPGKQNFDVSSQNASFSIVASLGQTLSSFQVCRHVLAFHSNTGWDPNTATTRCNLTLTERNLAEWAMEGMHRNVHHTLSSLSLNHQWTRTEEDDRQTALQSWCSLR